MGVGSSGIVGFLRSFAKIVRKNAKSLVARSDSLAFLAGAAPLKRMLSGAVWVASARHFHFAWGASGHFFGGRKP